MKRIFHWGLTAGRPPMIHFFLSLYAFKYLCWIWLTVAHVACALFSLSVHFCRYLLLPSDLQLLATPGCPEFIVCCFLSINLFSLCSSLTPTGRGRQPPTVSLLLVFPPKKEGLFYLLYYLFIYCEALAEEEFFVFFFKNLIAVTLPCNEANDFESLKLINCHLRFGTAILQQRVSTWKETWTSYGRTNHKQANNLDWLETGS